MFLEDEIDDLEQCSRRYSIRINCVPESEGESTVVIIKSVAKATDDEVTDDMIDRSHRMGPKSTTDHRSQATVVKFTSYRHKEPYGCQEEAVPNIFSCLSSLFRLSVDDVDISVLYFIFVRLAVAVHHLWTLSCLTFS